MKKFSKQLPVILFFIFFYSFTFSQTPVYQSPQATVWADYVFKRMTYEEKIGQLFMVPTWPNRDSTHVNYIVKLIDSLHLGGLIFFQGGPSRWTNLMNLYQSHSRIPLMIGIDGEWGLSMRIDSTIRFPRQMTLSSANNDSLIYEMGREIGRQCKTMGIHVNFAPVVDINNNPLNPVINSRSFGENKFAVTRHAGSYMKGMQDEGVMACAKHFPGHGNADSDSHFGLPIIYQSATELDTFELYPYKVLIKEGLASLMIAHLQIPALDTTPGLPSTLSKPIVTGLLQDKLNFRGLIFTDALDMKGVSMFYQSGELELKALQAGNDILLNTENVPAAITRIHFAIQNCEIEQSQIDASVKKILEAKYWCGLNRYQPIDVNGIYASLQSNDAAWLNYRLYENTVALLKNYEGIIPFKPYKEKKIASIVINDVQDNLFQQTLNNYQKVDCFTMSKDASDNDIKDLYIKLKTYDQVIVSVHNTTTNASKKFGITESMKYMVNKLAFLKSAVICFFGNPYTMECFEDREGFHAIMLAYEDTYLPQYFAAQAIFGANSFSGKLPVGMSGKYKAGNGISLLQNQPMKLTLPEEVIESRNPLAVIDSIISKSINDSVFPGCQVLAVKEGKIFYNKAFGNPVYGDTIKVKTTDLYDIASVTKIASTALAAMWLYDRHQLSLTAKISKYLPELKNSNKANITVGEMMAHQAGLQAWIPFYKNTIVNGELSDSIYHSTKDATYSIEVADSLWMNKDYQKKIWKELVASPVSEKGRYIYSDLGLIILQRIIEKVTGQKLDKFVSEKFYEPLGVWRMTYKPLEHFKPVEIIPTEIDTVFRNQLIHGYVHDPAAAMMGGVAGQAGVFSNAQSLSIVMQLLLNGGEYGGKRYIKKETVNLFTNQAFPETTNRRGFLFDKPDPNGSQSPAAASASSISFGHAGFTGTCAWADPKSEFIYIFLSNRVYPSAQNNQLAKRNIRTDIMESFYQSFKKVP